MVCLAVVVDEKRHIARHLSACEVADKESVVLQILGPSLELHVDGGLGLVARIDRPDARIHASRAQKLVRPRDVVAHRHAALRRAVTLVLKLQMEPHHELARLLVINDLGTLQNTPLLDGAARPFGRHSQSDALVAPIVKVLRRIAVYAHIGAVAASAFGLMLAEPPVTPFVKDDAAAVGVYGHAVFVRPHFGGFKTAVCTARHACDGRGQCREEYEDSSHNAEFYDQTKVRKYCGIST